MKEKAAPVFDIAKFRKDFITKRVIELDLSMRQVEKEIGVSISTLSRIENKKMVDIETFGRIIKWLNKNPNEYFNL